MMKNLRIILMLIFIFILFIPMVVCKHELSKDYIYSFKDEVVYNKCKYLIQEDHFGYVIYGVENDDEQYIAYIRPFYSEEVEKKYFDSKENLDEFIQDKTISYLEGVPVLDDFVEFDDNTICVSYKKPYGWDDVFKMAMPYYVIELLFFSFLNFVIILRNDGKTKYS